MDIKVSDIRKWHLLLLALGIMGSSIAAQAQTVCGPEVREAAAREIDAIAGLPEQEKAAAEANIHSKYKHCAQDAHGIPTNDPFFGAARQCGATVSQLGSLAYEEMSCCGYDPQRRQFGCPIKIKQTGGYGAAPLPGSRLFVLSCVADTNGVFVPVAVDSVHLSNEFLGQSPTWQFAVIASANQNLHTLQPMNGATRRARSILSWNSQPTSCTYQPNWGDALNYRIRLNQ